MNYNKSLTTKEQEYFFAHQLKAMEDDYSKYLNTLMSRHFSTSEAFLGKIVGFDAKRIFLLLFLGACPAVRPDGEWAFVTQE